MCQYNHYCNIDTISCSSHQTCEPKFDRRLNLDLFSVFYIFHCLWCASIFLFVPLISFLPNQSPGEDIMFLECERTLNLSTSFSPPCCQCKLRPLNSSFGGSSPFLFSVTYYYVFYFHLSEIFTPREMAKKIPRLSFYTAQYCKSETWIWISVRMNLLK